MTTEQSSAVQAAIQDFATRVKEDPNKIGYLDVNVEQLLMKGAVIRLRTGGYTGSTRITPEDLGWNEATMSELERRASNQLFSDLGNRPLVKDSIIKEGESIRSSARADIDRLTYRLFDGTTRFVPENAYEELIGKLERHQKRYYELRDDLVANLEQYREVLRPDYEVWVGRMYSQLHGWKQETDATKPDRDEWIASTVERLMILNKSPERIESQFKFEWTVSVLPLFEDLVRDQSVLREARVTSAVEREMVAERSRLQRDLLLSQQRTKEEELKEFWSDVRGTLREKLYLAMVDALAALENKNNLPSASVAGMRRLLDTITKMKFWQDDDLEAQINRVKILINAAEVTSTPDTTLMSKVMRSIGSEMRLQMLDLDYRPQRESRAGRKSGPEVGIPETREGLEFVLSSAWRQPRGTVVVDEDEEEDDILIERRSRATTTAED